MPPEPLPWDRRDFRKHERSGSDPRFGAGNFGGGGPQRWRDLPQQPPPHHHQNRHQLQQRWYSDFRSSRPIPPGHGKQGSWHTHSDEAGHGYLPFGSRYGDRNYEDQNPRPFVSRNEGRYFRNSRETRGSFAPKEWKASSHEPTVSPSGPGRPTTDFNIPKSVENIQTPQSNNGSKDTDSSHPPDLANPLAQSQSVQKEQHDKDGGTGDEPAITSQKVEKENGLVSMDWKPLKWHRSGSLSSRGSGFSPSSSSKSMAVDSIEAVAAKNPTLLQSPSTDADVSVSPGAPAHLDEESSRKKPRLGWGEGLAKYEKKKVDVPEECALRNGLVVSITNAETLQSHVVNLSDKSPRGVVRLQDCASPTSPSSVACSSSPGVDEKESVKPVNIKNDATKLSCSPGVVSRSHYDGPTLNLENLEMSSIANLSTLINEVLQSYDPNPTDTGYMQSSSMNKLLVLKVDTLKAIEVTESEIDSLETELKLLNAEPSEDQATTSKVTSRPPPLLAVSSGEMVIENKQVDEHVAMKDDDVDSPGSATSKHVEVQNSENSNEKFIDNDDGENGCNIELSMVNGSQDLATDSNMRFDFNDHCSVIWASNKDCANRAMEELYKVSPAKTYQFDISTMTSVPSMVKEKFQTRKWFLLLKEKILSIKFKVFSHFWKEGRVLSVRKLRLKSHKKFVHKMNPSISRPRITFSSGSSQTVPADEVIGFVNNLLSTMPCKPCRNSLKMPALILDKKEMKVSRFISDNNLVVDPCAIEKERSTINPWTSEETEIFVDKLAAFGKDFKKIASFLEHKTIADCIQFYYKNHKSELFERAKKKKPDQMKQTKPQATTYLVASGKRWNRETNAASLDILGAASAIAENVKDGIEIPKKSMSKSFFGPSTSKASKGEDVYDNERETVAADVLAGICVSISSEAMSSCITSSVDPGDVYHQDWRYQRIGSKRPLTPEVTQSIDEECSDESCGEGGPADWTDEEKSLFLHAVSLYGKDFAMISRSVGTRNREQCKVYFSKARKCLGLDVIGPDSDGADSCDVNGGGSDVEDACDVCNEGSGSKMEEDVNLDRSSDLKKCVENNEAILKDSSVGHSQMEEKPVLELNLEDTERNSVKSSCVLPVNTESICVEEKVASVGAYEGHNRELSQGQQLLLPSENLNIDKVEDANSSEASAVSCTVNELKSDSCVSHPSIGANSLMQIDKVSESLNKAGDKPHLVPLQENSQLASMKSSTLFSVPIKYQTSPPHNPLSVSNGTNRIYNKHSQNHSGYALSDPVESLQILRGYPVSVQNKKPINNDVNFKRSVPLHDGILHSDRQTGFSLRKCSSSNLSQRNHSRAQSSGASDVPRNGDVKLFGKVLTSSQPKTNSSAEQNEPFHKPSSQTLNLRFNGDLKVNSDSSQSKSEGSNFIGSENVPVNSCCFWNRNRIQTGFSTQLPDSALLLNKYPSLFSNYPIHTAKSVQSSIPSTSNGVFAIDTKQQQDMLFSEMQRRIGFDVMSGMQQQARGVVGRGVLASGVSDPVAAVKMHYANAEQFSLQNGNILKEDDLWRSNGHLGR